MRRNGATLGLLLIPRLSIKITDSGIGAGLGPLLMPNLDDL